MPAQTAQEFFAEKISRPSEMTTAQWDLVRADSRARAFFMAAVTNAEILQINRDATALMLEGRLSLQEARRYIREGLTKGGYTAKPGEEGTIKDLMTPTRQNIMLETNLAMARGHAVYSKQLIARRAFPAKRMVRVRGVREPRDWPQRWRDAARVSPPEGMSEEFMAATIDHPVWTRLSRFGLPYAPYDFRSGMGDEIMPRDKAKAAGLLSAVPPKKGPTETPAIDPKTGKTTVAPSFNEGLEAKPAVTDPELKQRLADDLAGLAKWSGDKLIFTDPNGTKPYAAAEIPAVIGTPNRASVPLLQAEALQAWAEKGAAGLLPGRNALYHFRRLVHRIRPMLSNALLSLERAFDSLAGRAEALASLQPGAVWEPEARGFPFTAFTKSASKSATSSSAGPALRLVVESHYTARDLTPAVKALATTDANARHVLFERGAAFVVLRIEGEETAERITVFLKEVDP